MTTTDIGKLTRDAQAAQAALAAAQDAQAALAAAAAEERRQRSISWAFRRVSTYPGRQAEANGHVTQALAAFDAAVTADYGTAPAAYLTIVRAMAAANGVGAEYAKARGILRAAGLIAPENQGHSPDPIGLYSAPYPPRDLPPFLEMAGSSLEVARTAAFRQAPATEDPGSFSGPPPSDAERQAILAYEWTFSQELEHLLGYREQYPELYARNVPEAQRIEVAAYAAGRAAAGRGDDPLPKVAVQSTGRGEAPTFAADAPIRVTLYGQEGHAPSR